MAFPAQGRANISSAFLARLAVKAEREITGSALGDMKWGRGVRVPPFDNTGNQGTLTQLLNQFSALSQKKTFGALRF